MTVPSERPATLRAALAAVIEDASTRCTRCGVCYDACPMTRYAPALAGAQPVAAVAGVLDLLHGGEGSPEALAWIGVCAQSSLCSRACPERIDWMRVIRAGKMAAHGSLGGPTRLAPREEPKFFERINAFSTLSLGEEETLRQQR